MLLLGVPGVWTARLLDCSTALGGRKSIMYKGPVRSLMAPRVPPSAPSAPSAQQPRLHPRESRALAGNHCPHPPEPCPRALGQSIWWHLVAEVAGAVWR
jgi:hypothetical protein